MFLLLGETILNRVTFHYNILLVLVLRGFKY